MAHSTARTGTATGLPPAALALLHLPAISGVTDGQKRGADCVWCACGPLTAETAIDYGEQLSPLDSAPDSARQRWYPRSCRSCTRDRAYRALLDHAPACTDGCADTPGCEIGRALNRLIREARR
ncbi:hypothetical protein [Streptomyces sp. NPDC020996]|uniref:hypothetical protein n=1 Tax=Streptomyces sp. NPDC020996 TaxID=3154791 RepID=UPI0033EF0A0D